MNTTATQITARLTQLVDRAAALAAQTDAEVTPWSIIAAAATQARAALVSIELPAAEGLDFEPDGFQYSEWTSNLEVAVALETLSLVETLVDDLIERTGSVEARVAQAHIKGAASVALLVQP